MQKLSKAHTQLVAEQFWINYDSEIRFNLIENKSHVPVVCYRMSTRSSNPQIFLPKYWTFTTSQTFTKQQCFLSQYCPTSLLWQHWNIISACNNVSKCMYQFKTLKFCIQWIWIRISVWTWETEREMHGDNLSGQLGQYKWFQNKYMLSVKKACTHFFIHSPDSKRNKNVLFFIHKFIIFNRL